MLIWLAQGWEEFARWGVKEEAEIARLVLSKWNDIKEAASYVKRHKDQAREVELGVGSQGRKYVVEVTFEGRSAGGRDFMQIIGHAPATTIGLDIMAKSLKSDLPSDGAGHNIFVGHVYDDGKSHAIRILGIDENKHIIEMINRSFDDL